MIIGFTCLTGDLLHAGHIAMLQECKERCDYLIVGLNTNHFGKSGGRACVQSVFERFVQLDAVKYVDKIIPYESETDLELLLKTININIRFIGEDYKDKDFTGKQICETRNIKVYYNNRLHSLSTTELKERIKTGQ